MLGTKISNLYKGSSVKVAFKTSSCTATHVSWNFKRACNQQYMRVCISLQGGVIKGSHKRVYNNNVEYLGCGDSRGRAWNCQVNYSSYAMRFAPESLIMDFSISYLVTSQANFSLHKLTTFIVYNSKIILTQFFNWI